MSEHLLEISNVSKSFGSVNVLKGINFTLDSGSVHAICGENGAGKSTLMKIIAGIYHPDSGQMLLDGKAYHPVKPWDALKNGISMIHQELDLAEHLTVAENIFLGCEHTNGIFLDNKRMVRETQQLIDDNGFQLDANSLVSELSVGENQMVEILKALHAKSKIIVMDEPTSALSEKETRQLFDIVNILRKRGLGIIYISHRMEEFIEIADMISTLRNGEIVRTVPMSEITIPEIIHDMVGHELKDFYPPRQVEIGEVSFQVIGLSDGQKIHDVSFQVRKGEIVGLAGLIGAGRTEIANAICGVTKATGRLQLLGQEISVRNPSDAIKAGIAYLTEDRKRTGLCLNLPCSWNMTMPTLDKINKSSFLDLKKELEIAREMGQRVGVKWSSPETQIGTLSGGNQQKILLARWLLADSNFLIFDEPTRGIDVGAKTEVYTLLNMLAEQGKAILIISSELPELFGVTDRILVIREGRVAADLVTRETTQEIVMKFAATSQE